MSQSSWAVSGRCAGNLKMARPLEPSRTTSGTMTAIGTYTLKPTDAGTIVTYVTDYEFHKILWKILDKLMLGRWMEKDSEKALGNLKRILEK